MNIQAWFHAVPMTDLIVVSYCLNLLLYIVLNYHVSCLYEQIIGSPSIVKKYLSKNECPTKNHPASPDPEHFSAANSAC
uniref:Uncharacterized protein n=1 Tax=Arundo donax TaxID=35708 RepID=A0A0A8Y4B9_ARUDO